MKKFACFYLVVILTLILLTGYILSASGIITMEFFEQGHKSLTTMSNIHTNCPAAEEDFVILDNRNGTCMITSYVGPEYTVLEVPSSINGLKVVGLCSGAITNVNIRKLILPATITFMEKGAISNTPCLANVIGPMPDHVASFIPNSFPKYDMVFLDGRYRETVTNSGKTLVKDDMWLKPAPEEDFCTLVFDDGSCAITSYEGKCESVLKVPETIDGYTVTAVSWDAIYQMGNAKRYILPDTVTSVGTTSSLEELIK